MHDPLAVDFFEDPDELLAEVPHAANTQLMPLHALANFGQVAPQQIQHHVRPQGRFLVAIESRHEAPGVVQRNSFDIPYVVLVAVNLASVSILSDRQRNWKRSSMCACSS